MRFLFIYPNHKGMTMLPPGIALLSACLKKEGHEVKLFDTTIYNKIEYDNKIIVKDAEVEKAEKLNVRPVKKSNVKIKNLDTSPFEDLEELIKDFKPEFLGLSCTEDMWELGSALLTHIKKYKIRTIAGGVFPTFGPEIVLKSGFVDWVCKGEGEGALVELLKRIKEGKNWKDIPNLCFLENNELKCNPTKVIDMDRNPTIDLKLFDKNRYYRPMSGTMYKMFPVETHRGCPYKCTFCNSPSQLTMYKSETNSNQLRRKSFQNIEKELLFYKNEMEAEYLYFWADTFFVWSKKELEKFAEIYEKIKLPFWCQTRPETITEERVNILKEIGLHRMSLGVEHGNEKFRAKYILRKMPNSLIVDRLNLLYDLKVSFSVNNIMGFPKETRELAFDTIKLNRRFKANDRNCYAFTPFHGTGLRKLAEQLGYIDKNDITSSMTTGQTPLNMPQFPRKEVEGLCKTFNFYVNFPEDRWDEIKIAENNNTEGKEMYNKLKDEFVKEYWDGELSFEESAAANDPHSELYT